MEEKDEIREKIENTLLEAYRNEYKEHISIWQNLESKAQGTVAMSGVFLAGIFAFIRQLGDQSNDVIRVLLVFAIIFLALSLLSCILVLKTRKRPALPGGAIVEKIVVDLIEGSANNVSASQYLLFIRDQTKAWSRVNMEINKINNDKAKHLWIAHRFIISSLGIVLLIATLNIFKGGTL